MNRRLQRNTPEEEAAIQRGIAADPDTFEVTEEDFARARPAHEVLRSDLFTKLVRRRGPQKSPRKVPVNIRLDAGLVQRLRASGPGWQTRVNDLLLKAGE